MAFQQLKGGAALIAFLCGIVVATGMARAETEAPRSRVITVVGLGRERGAPDTAQMQIAVEHTAPTAKAASQAAARTATQVIESLRKEIGSGGRVQSAAFQLNPVYRPIPDRGSGERPLGPEIIAYTAVNQLEVETGNVEAVGALIDAAVAAGAARAQNVAFTVTDRGPLQARALQAASSDATTQARAIADGLHVRLGPVIEATTELGARPVFERRGAFAMAAEAGAADTPIEPREVTVDARLRVTYAIE